VECPKIIEQLTTLLQNWKGPENCAQGGERCLYDVSDFEHTKNKLKLGRLTLSLCVDTRMYILLNKGNYLSAIDYLNLGAS